jgi:NDP-sugar pyrophosphorylase family protein
MGAASHLPVAVLAVGLATRLKPITEKIPKLLVEVAGEPFFSHQIRLLRRSGFQRLVLCVGYLGEKIVEAYGDGSQWGVKIDYSFDGPRLLGTGGALIQALPKLGDTFHVLYGDSYLPIDYAAVEETFLSSHRNALMTVYENHDRFDNSNVWFEKGSLRLYDKTCRLPEMKFVDYGFSSFKAVAFAPYPRDTPVDLSTIQHDLSRRGELVGYEVKQRFYEIGSHTGLKELDQLLRVEPAGTD